MAKIQVSFDLKTTESTQSFQTKGIKRDTHITFQDEEGFKHQIFLEENRLRYLKFGKGNLALTFEEGHLHKGTFETLNHVLNFDIQTDILHIEASHIVVHYKLLTDKEVVHTAQLELKFSMLEEVKHGRS